MTNLHDVRVEARSDYAYCPIHGDLLAGVRSYRCANAPVGHEYADAVVTVEMIADVIDQNLYWKKRMSDGFVSTGMNEPIDIARAVHALLRGGVER